MKDGMARDNTSGKKKFTKTLYTMNLHLHMHLHIDMKKMDRNVKNIVYNMSSMFSHTQYKLYFIRYMTSKDGRSDRNMKDI